MESSVGFFVRFLFFCAQSQCGALIQSSAQDLWRRDLTPGLRPAVLAVAILGRALLAVSDLPLFGFPVALFEWVGFPVAVFEWVGFPVAVFERPFWALDPSFG